MGLHHPVPWRNLKTPHLDGTYSSVPCVGIGALFFMGGGGTQKKQQNINVLVDGAY